MLDKIAQFAYSSRSTVQHTYDTAKQLIEEGIEGSFIEAGVGAGAQIGSMQLANMKANYPKEIYGFDSFEGIPLAGEHDTSQPGIGVITHDVHLPLSERLVSSGVTVHSKAEVEKNILDMQLPLTNITFISGWFQESVPIWSGAISFLRLDGDLFESTYVCLQHLYPFLSVGGVCVVDDYSLPGCRKAVHDYFENYKRPYPSMQFIAGSDGPVWFKKYE